MSSAFDRWEKDPFFSAAEEVQESADRMESVYRRWMHERRSHADHAESEEGVAGELRRELHTALGTAKWQLEEFDRASRSSDERSPSKDGTRIRHTQFISALGNQILTVESSLRESVLEEGGADLSWVRLDDGERDELALFLSGSSLPQRENVPVSVDQVDDHLRWGDSQQTDERAVLDCSMKPPRPFEVSSWEGKGEKIFSHRRTASASSDIEAWAISVNEYSSRISVDDHSHPSLPKVLSLSGLAGVTESPAKLKWVKNGFRKWKLSDHHDASESIPLQNHQVSQELDPCYERSKSFISGCSDESYNKQLYGWLGTFQRQMQRSQYQFQYGRPLQVFFWVAVSLLLIVFFILRTI